MLKFLWQSKPQVQRSSLKLVSGPIRDQLDLCLALIGPDTNLREFLQTLGLLCQRNFSTSEWSFLASNLLENDWLIFIPENQSNLFDTKMKCIEIWNISWSYVACQLNCCSKSYIYVFMKFLKNTLFFMLLK